MKKFSLILTASLSLFSLSALADNRPNILLIVADDLGYADLGVHGSRIQTPNIDNLAQQGVIFSQFHTAPLCAPSRSMLLTGNNNHVAGMGNQLPSQLDGTPGFEHHLSDRIATLPSILKDAGYHTYMAGKWHLGSTLEHSPYQAGFERSFALDDGGGNHFDNRGFMPYPSKYFEDNAWGEWPVGKYSTEYYTDRLIDDLNQDKDSDKPFFIYAAYTSPHWPLQVPDEELDRYKGAYNAGYEALREENLSNLKKAGLIAADHPMPQLHPAVKAWAELSDDEKRRESRKMELYAAMVSNLDDNIGRLIGHLKTLGKLDKTFIIFMSDNGAAPSDLYNRGPFTKAIRQKYNNDKLEDFGKANSFISYGIAWAEAGSAPFKNHKTHPEEGGIRTPMIISGHCVKGSQGINHQYATVMDIAPTVLELANTEYPNDEQLAPLQGSSLMATIQDKTKPAHSNEYVTVLDHNNNTFARKGHWKLISHDAFEEGSYKLFNLLDDPTESRDVSAEYPNIYNEIQAEWHKKAKQYGIVKIPNRLKME